MTEYLVIASRAAVFGDPLALYVETNPGQVVILRRLDRGAEVRGHAVWRTLPDKNTRVRWIALDDGGYVLPDTVRPVQP